MINLVSLQRRMRSMARVIAYSSALKMLALLGNRTVLAEFLATTAEATRSPLFEPSVCVQPAHSLFDRESYFGYIQRSDQRLQSLGLP